MKITGKLLSATRRAALKASVGGPTMVEFASRVLLDSDGRTTRMNFADMTDAEMDRTDLFDKALGGRAVTVEDSTAAPGTAIVECWTYRVLGGVGAYRDIELEDTVYVGIVDRQVVGASAHFIHVKCAVDAALAAR